MLFKIIIKINGQEDQEVVCVGKSRAESEEDKDQEGER